MIVVTDSFPQIALAAVNQLHVKWLTLQYCCSHCECIEIESLTVASHYAKLEDFDGDFYQCKFSVHLNLFLS